MLLLSSPTLLLAEPLVTTPARDPVTLTGRLLMIDDALFEGCYHNAFEGAMET